MINTIPFGSDDGCPAGGRECLLEDPRLISGTFVSLWLCHRVCFLYFLFLLQFLFVGTNIGLFVGYFFFYKDDPGFRYLNDITGVSLSVHTISWRHERSKALNRPFFGFSLVSRLLERVQLHLTSIVSWFCCLSVGISFPSSAAHSVLAKYACTVSTHPLLSCNIWIVFRAVLSEYAAPSR